MMAAVFPHGVHRSPFRPAWWLSGAHGQTVFSAFFRRPPQPPRQRERLWLPDDDFVDVDYCLPAGWQAGQSPLVLIIHGLSGSSDSHYVLGLQQALLARGWASAAMNCRGASGEPNRSVRAYHAGASDDVAAVLHGLRRRFPGTPLAVVGYSLGGAMTLRLLGEQGADAGLFAAVAVSAPLQLGPCATRMDRGLSRMYRQHMLDRLMAHWQEKLSLFEREGRHEDVARIRSLRGFPDYRSFWDFDDALVAPLHGYRDVHDYYDRAASRPILRHIRVPTLIVHSLDDPFMTPEIVPRADELSPWVHLELADRGGHVGFIDGGSPRVPRYYLEQRIPQFLAAAFHAIQSKDELLR